MSPIPIAWSLVCPMPGEGKKEYLNYIFVNKERGIRLVERGQSDIPSTAHFLSSISLKFSKNCLWSDMCFDAPESAKKAKMLRGSKSGQETKAPAPEEGMGFCNAYGVTQLLCA